MNKRFVDAGLAATRLRPDALLIPQNMRAFAAAMEQQGQPFDYLLYATITSGTTRENKDYQRDYLLTLELVNVARRQYDKQAATISKGYYHSHDVEVDEQPRPEAVITGSVSSMVLPPSRSV